MSVGCGVIYLEFNLFDIKDMQFYQIWLMLLVVNIEFVYDMRDFIVVDKDGKLKFFLFLDGCDGFMVM